MDAPTQIPAGWYQDPHVQDVSLRRWWTGYAWSENVAQVPLDSRPAPAPAPADSIAPVVFDKKAHNLLVATGVFETLLGLIFLSYFVLHPPVFFVLCEIAVAVTTLILEINAVRLRRRTDSIGAGQIILQLLMGVLGILWFVLPVVETFVSFVTHNPSRIFAW